MRTRIVTHHLEMTGADQLRPARPARAVHVWQRAAVPSPELSHFLYRAVGGDWYWYTRLDWTRERWRAHVERDALETWIGAVDGTPAGYAELEAQAEGAVEIVYFGLLPSFIGRGLGGALLTDAVRRAWAMGATRVWLHTCNLDHPHALAHYQARGFRVFKVEEHEEDLPERSPGYWDGVGNKTGC
jgi:ribosomal protein S18 acetylase RimI-like enzyme